MELLINGRQDRKHRVVGLFLPGTNLAGVFQDFVLGPILFLIYINYLPDGIKAICKLFANGKSLFSKVKDKSCSAFELKNDLKVISNWVSQ